jgi:hypothetical protein
MLDLRRRQFITLLGGGAIAWPLGAGAQQPTRIAKIGHLESGWPSSSPNLVAAFRQGLRELGYIEGQNLFVRLQRKRSGFCWPPSPRRGPVADQWQR